MSTSFGIKELSIKDPQNPRDGGDGEGGKWPEVITDGGGWVISDATEHGGIIKPIAIGGGETNIGGGTGGSGIKHLSDPWVIEDPAETINQEDWFGPVGPGPGYIKVGGSQLGKPVTGDIVYFGGDGDGIIKTGSRIPVIWKGGDSGYISDTNIPKHEVPKHGDDQYDAAVEYSGKRYTGRTKEWLGGSQLGRTSEDISGGEGLDHEWYIEGDLPLDPTWVSGHTNSFKEKDFGVCAFDSTSWKSAHTCTFSGTESL